MSHAEIGDRVRVKCVGEISTPMGRLIVLGREGRVVGVARDAKRKWSRRLLVAFGTKNEVGRVEVPSAWLEVIALRSDRGRYAAPAT